ncbi:MAG: hypothetical protein BSOLF_0027 [Candidatus Carbobacillus altaicus]|uniref:Fin: required for the switch from sigmaF to sigmaG during sporulation n=1 Tax=Candidatus Carbonibacillus altaicus TaxID=2163959 RepID=A0A2R6Y1N1_9BACL|nr:MAG: hypothetical protein BSOLF_0027 [Candidatus Carbobacillus altaicus]
MIIYQCRSCRTVLGTFADGESRIEALLETLTPEERDTIIEQVGDNRMVYVLCEHCQDALNRHPELYDLTSPLQ